jgi:hypothetical protein
MNSIFERFKTYFRRQFALFYDNARVFFYLLGRFFHDVGPECRKWALEILDRPTAFRELVPYVDEIVSAALACLFLYVLDRAGALPADPNYSASVFFFCFPMVVDHVIATGHFLELIRNVTPGIGFPIDIVFVRPESLLSEWFFDGHKLHLYIPANCNAQVPFLCMILEFRDNSYEAYRTPGLWVALPLQYAIFGHLQYRARLFLAWVIRHW